MEEWTFKCEDKVMYRRHSNPNNKRRSCWTYGVFSHYELPDYAIINGLPVALKFHDIVHYGESNKKYVGTDVDLFDNEILLEDGSLIVCFDNVHELGRDGSLGQLMKYNKEASVDFFKSSENSLRYSFCVPYETFFPNDIALTSKFICKIKDGRVYSLTKCNL